MLKCNLYTQKSNSLLKALRLMLPFNMVKGFALALQSPLLDTKPYTYKDPTTLWDSAPLFFGGFFGAWLLSTSMMDDLQEL